MIELFLKTGFIFCLITIAIKPFGFLTIGNEKAQVILRPLVITTLALAILCGLIAMSIMVYR